MVVRAQQGQVGQIGRTTVGLPLLHVVAVGEEDMGAARKDAMAIAAEHLSALGRGGVALRPALVHGVALGVVEGHDHLSVTGQAPGHVRADQPGVLELAGQLRVRIAQDLEGHMGHHQGRPRGSRRSRRGQRHEGVGQALVEAGLAVRAHRLDPGLEHGTHRGVGDRRQLGHDGARAVVEAQGALLLVRSIRRPGRQLLGTHQRPEVLEGEIAGGLGPLGLGLGGRHRDHRTDLVEVEATRGQAGGQVRKIAHTFSHLGIGPRRGVRDPQMLGQPGAQRGPTGGPPVLAALQLGTDRGQHGVLGAADPKGPGRQPHQLGSLEPSHVGHSQRADGLEPLRRSVTTRLRHRRENGRPSLLRPRYSGRCVENCRRVRPSAKPVGEAGLRSRSAKRDVRGGEVQALSAPRPSVGAPPTKTTGWPAPS